MRFSIPSARKLRAAIRFLVLVVACPIGSIHSLGGSFLVEPWLQAAARPTVQNAVPESPAEEGPDAAESLVEPETPSLGYGTRVIGAMIVVLALILITMILLKRYMPHQFGALGQQRRMQVVETLPIGEKRSLTLIRIDNEELLLASTPGHVALLKEIRAEQHAVETIFRGSPTEAKILNTPKSPEPSANVAPGSQSSRRFADVLADEVGEPSNDSAAGLLSQLRSLRQELEAR